MLPITKISITGEKNLLFHNTLVFDSLFKTEHFAKIGRFFLPLKKKKKKGCVEDGCLSNLSISLQKNAQGIFSAPGTCLFIYIFI